MAARSAPRPGPRRLLAAGCLSSSPLLGCAHGTQIRLELLKPAVLFLLPCPRPRWNDHVLAWFPKFTGVATGVGVQLQ